MFLLLMQEISKAENKHENKMRIAHEMKLHFRIIIIDSAAASDIIILREIW